MTTLMALSAVGRTSYLSVLGALAMSLGWCRAPTPGALSQARGKVPMTTTRDLWQQVRDALAESISDATTQVAGRRVVAIDGMRVLVPDHPEAERRFGRPTARPGQKRPLPQALVVLGFDVFSRVLLGCRCCATTGLNGSGRWR